MDPKGRRLHDRVRGRDSIQLATDQAEFYNERA